MNKSTLSTEELAELGEQIYHRDILPKLSTDAHGQFLVLDVATGDCEIAPEDPDASKKLLERHPAGNFTA